LRPRLGLLIFIVFTLGSTGALIAETSFRLSEIGFRAGSGIGKDHDFRQTELFSSLTTPWARTTPSGNFRADLEAHAGGGILRNSDATAALFYAGPGLRLSAPGFPLYLTAGSAPTYLTRSRFGDVDLGQRLQFTSSAAITLMLTPEIGLRYRAQHMSNARLARPNPGINTHSAGIVIVF
jgi:hypothetical protein